MSSNDFTLVDVAGWEWDLHGVYSAYMGHFQSHNIVWWDRSWAVFFTTFEAFLGFGWPTIVITDRATSRGHVVTRTSSLQAFTRMIKTRFGELMPNIVDNLIAITPFEAGKRPLRNINDMMTYKKVYATLPAAELSAMKARVRQGNVREISKLWRTREKTFLAVDFECSEKSSVILEWGYSAIRSAHLDGMNVWPPVPEDNYRKGHYIVQEYVDKVKNKFTPTFPWQYAWGDSHIVPKAKLAEIIQAIINSLASPEQESTANNLVLVCHTPDHDQEKFKELKIKLPSNVLIIDIATFERNIYLRNVNNNAPVSQNRDPSTILSLSKILKSFNVQLRAPLHNSGNDAFYIMLAFQLLVDPEGTIIPPPKAPKNDPFPVVAAPSTPNGGDFSSNGTANGRDYSSTRGRMSRRMSAGNWQFPFLDESGNPTMGSESGAGRMSMMSMPNGSMPSFFPGVHGPSPLGGVFPAGATMNGTHHRDHTPGLPQSYQSVSGASGRNSPAYHRGNTPNGRGGAGESGSRERSRDRSGGSELEPPRAPFAREGGTRSRSFNGNDDREKENQRQAQKRTNSSSSPQLHQQRRPASSSVSDSVYRNSFSSQRRPVSSPTPNQQPPLQSAGSSSSLARPGIRITQHGSGEPAANGSGSGKDSVKAPSIPLPPTPTKSKGSEGFFSAIKRFSTKH